jgi:hypothetical protein
MSICVHPVDVQWGEISIGKVRVKIYEKFV